MATQDDIKKIIEIVQNTINEDKENFHNITLDIKSGHMDFPPETILYALDLLSEEIENNINKYFNQNKID